MHHLANFVLVTSLVACVADDTGFVDPTSEPDVGSYLPNPDTKADAPTACGSSSCVAALCGEACPAGDLCQERCFPQDLSAATFVRFEASGAATIALDSRAVVGGPWDGGLDNVVIFGADLWEFRDAAGEPETRQGLEIMYRDIVSGGFVAAQPYTHGPTTSIYIRDFRGSGQYTAAGRFSTGRVRAVENGPATGDLYASTAETCTVTITAANDGGLDGAFDCVTIPGAVEVTGTTGSVSLRGSFHLAPTSIDRPRILSR